MIEIQVRAGRAEKQQVDTILLPLLSGRRLTVSGERLQEACDHLLTPYLRKFDTEGEPGETLTIYKPEGTACERLILFGTGEERKLTLDRLRGTAAKVARHLDRIGTRHAALCLAELPVRGASVADRVQAIAEGLLIGLYRFDKYKSKPKRNPRPLNRVTLLIDSRRALDDARRAVAVARATAKGVALARDLANEPGNVCTPSFLADQAEALAGEGLTVEVWGKERIAEEGMNALLAVNRGSAEEPRFIVLRYNGGSEDQAPIALVGKGLTFDSGGISIKPAAQMDEMKFDMCGAAAVLGTFKAAKELQLPCNLLGVIPATENLSGAAAYKPGDVITALDGTTIEVVNTDAEGRLILADALAWAARQKPAQIIDLATLTGACVIALGAHASGLLGNDERMIKALQEAGRRSGDRAWPLPLFDDYQEQIKSEIADIKNVGGREAGAITAACFLSRFVGKLPWAHLDIAGTAWNSKGSPLTGKGATGAGVRLLTAYLLGRSG
ncbi:MAG: leucyl aminopeptidase [Zetaproteobacteria bacterium]|nr:MAG: leucyl aminopeptidase [Zetaproteobacteria bacterium]